MTRVTERLQNGDRPLLSLEITPPDRGQSIDELFHNIDSLMPMSPEFINVTYHQAYEDYEEKNGSIVRRPRRKKPGTVGICAAIKNRFAVEPVAHLICGGFDRWETEDALIDLHYLGIRNILALRGDPPPGQSLFRPKKDGYAFAADLVAQIRDMNQGVYVDALDDPVPTSFSIGVAGYPEKHVEAANRETDIRHLKEKVDQGADYVVTQMFFSARLYKDYVARAREAGITVPIIPGIKPITTPRQLERIPRTFFVSLPDALVQSICEARTAKEAFKRGTDSVAELAGELLEAGAPGLHLFTMGKGRGARAVLTRLFGSHR
ncbi:MAG TPA: methylenetetrahydrofolate reductase [NAD(P)H] [Candidatus Aminicenantes bacterium]|mgnify:CR=1 FL=1|nr:methylenetetrahydrofolate reductase [NAD(P)H] [Candidatus Aminicenantes bacterium]